MKLAASDYGLKNNFSFKQIEIIREYQPDMPQVLCQGSKIQQVILNLLTNGAQAMGEAKDRKNGVFRFILKIRQENDIAHIEVEDTGSGMEKSICEKVFEPFFTTKQEGTGLGLSISYFIITDNHKGTMEVESTLGKGTKFIIKLPLTKK